MKYFIKIDIHNKNTFIKCPICFKIIPCAHLQIMRDGYDRSITETFHCQGIPCKECPISEGNSNAIDTICKHSILDIMVFLYNSHEELKWRLELLK